MSLTEFVPAHLNPFAIKHVIRIPYVFEEGNWKCHLARLQSLNFRAAIVGPQGCGKTTLLEELVQRLPATFDVATFHLFLPQEKHLHEEMLLEALQESAQDKILLVDGIERLSFFQRRRLYRETRNRAGLVVNVHHKCRLPTWVKCRPNMSLLFILLAQLRLNTPVIRFAAEVYFRKFRGNVREVFRSLYDDFSAGRISQRSNS